MTSAPLSTAQRTRLGDLLVVRTSRPRCPGRRRPRPRGCSASGATPITPLPVAGAAPGEQRGDHRAVCAVGRSPTGVCPSGCRGPRHPCRPRPTPRSSATLPFDARVDHRDRDALAARGVPGGREAVVVEPVLEVAHGVGVRRGGAGEDDRAPPRRARRRFARRAQVHGCVGAGSSARLSGCLVERRLARARRHRSRGTGRRSGDHDERSSAMSPIGFAPGPPRASARRARAGT